MDAELALFDGAQRLDQCGHVEDVAQAFAIGLEEHREAGIAGCYGQQIVGPFALLPERGSSICTAAGQEQGAACGFAKTPGEECRCSQLAQDELHDFGGLDHEPVGGGWFVAVGEAEDEAVVTPEGFDIRTTGGADAGCDGHGPGNVNAAAEGGEDADAPVAQLVAGALDDDVAVVGNLAGSFLLVGEEAHEVFGCAGVEVVVADEAAQGCREWHSAQLADHGADAAAEFQRAAGTIAFPEGHFAGFAGCG